METIISLGNGQDQSLRDMVHSELAFKLGGSRGRIKKLNVSLKPVGSEIQCRVLATLKDGLVVCFSTQHENPQVCISDGIARLNRHVLRNVNLRHVS